MRRKKKYLFQRGKKCTRPKMCRATVGKRRTFTLLSIGRTTTAGQDPVFPGEKRHMASVKYRRNKK